MIEKRQEESNPLTTPRGTRFAHRSLTVLLKRFICETSLQKRSINSNGEETNRPTTPSRKGSAQRQMKWPSVNPQSSCGQSRYYHPEGKHPGIPETLGHKPATQEHTYLAAHSMQPGPEASPSQRIRTGNGAEQKGS